MLLLIRTIPNPIRWQAPLIFEGMHMGFLHERSNIIRARVWLIRCAVGLLRYSCLNLSLFWAMICHDRSFEVRHICSTQLLLGRALVNTAYWWVFRFLLLIVFVSFDFLISPFSRIACRLGHLPLLVLLMFLSAPIKIDIKDTLWTSVP